MSWVVMSFDPVKNEVTLKTPDGKLVTTTIPSSEVYTLESRNAHLNKFKQRHNMRRLGKRAAIILSIGITAVILFLRLHHVIY